MDSNTSPTTTENDCDVPGFSKRRFPGPPMGWFEKAYKNAVAFYNVDSKLTVSDRNQLSTQFSSISNIQTAVGFTTFSSFLLGPCLFRYYKAGAIKGLRLGKWIIFGFLASIGAQNMAIRYKYSQVINDMERGDRMDEKNRTEMFKLLKNTPPGMWERYFRITGKDESKRFPDPNSRLKLLMENDGKVERRSFLNQRDPLGLYENIPKNKLPSEQEKENSTEIQQPLPTSWDKVRESKNSNEKQDSNINDDPFEIIDDLDLQNND